MAPVKLYGRVATVGTSRVIACLYEKGVDFEFIPINMAVAEHKNEPFISLNPFGMVPALEDGDLKLFESRAITQYLARKYAAEGNQLIHEDPEKMAIISMWMEAEPHHFDPAAMTLTVELVAASEAGRVTNDVLVAECEAKLAKDLDIYEARLAKSKYLGGDDFTLADLHHVSNIGHLMGTKVKEMFDSRPNVSEWCANILARSAWVKAVALRNKFSK